jgi:hypothetical protein
MRTMRSATHGDQFLFTTIQMKGGSGKRQKQTEDQQHYAQLTKPSASLSYRAASHFSQSGKAPLPQYVAVCTDISRESS